MYKAVECRGQGCITHGSLNDRVIGQTHIRTAISMVICLTVSEFCEFYLHQTELSLTEHSDCTVP